MKAIATYMSRYNGWMISIEGKWEDDLSEEMVSAMEDAAEPLSELTYDECDDDGEFVGDLSAVEMQVQTSVLESLGKFGVTEVEIAEDPYSS